MVELLPAPALLDPLFDDRLQLAKNVLLFVLLRLRLILVVVYLEYLLDFASFAAVYLLSVDNLLLLCGCIVKLWHSRHVIE